MDSRDPNYGSPPHLQQETTDPSTRDTNHIMEQSSHSSAPRACSVAVFACVAFLVVVAIGLAVTFLVLFHIKRLIQTPGEFGHRQERLLVVPFLNASEINVASVTVIVDTTENRTTESDGNEG